MLFEMEHGEKRFHPLVSANSDARMDDVALVYKPGSALDYKMYQFAMVDNEVDHEAPQDGKELPRDRKERIRKKENADFALKLEVLKEHTIRLEGVQFKDKSTGETFEVDWNNGEHFSRAGFSKMDFLRNIGKGATATMNIDLYICAIFSLIPDAEKKSEEASDAPDDASEEGREGAYRRSGDLDG